LNRAIYFTKDRGDKIMRIKKQKHSHDKPGRDLLMAMAILIALYGIYTLQIA